MFLQKHTPFYVLNVINTKVCQSVSSNLRLMAQQTRDQTKVNKQGCD